MFKKKKNSQWICFSANLQQVGNMCFCLFGVVWVDLCLEFFFYNFQAKTIPSTWQKHRGDQDIYCFLFCGCYFYCVLEETVNIFQRFGANLTTLIYRFTFAFAFPFTDLIVFNLSCYWAFCFIAFNFITIINTLPSVRWHFTACWFVK